MALKQKIYTFIKAITPPVFFELYRHSFVHRLIKRITRKMGEARPEWRKTTGGILSGREFFFTGKPTWQKEMLEGSYDSFFFDYLKGTSLDGKTVFEIGAHIGYHTLCFASLVGPKGKVVAFEPNPFNVSYIRDIIQRNTDVASRISIFDVALSSKDGVEEFISSDKIDEGLSSGGFIDSADPIWEKNIFEKETGFTRMKVRTIPLDSIPEVQKGTLIPDMLKIDVEGAEGLVIEGAMNTLRKHSPLILIEIHSIKNMYDVLSQLSSIGYKSKILKKEKDGRCFLVFQK